MSKQNFVLGKKQIILASLTMILGLAIYVNYILSSPKPELAPTSVINGGGDFYNDAILVSTTKTEDYFAKTRLERDTSRAQAKETLEGIYNGGDMTEEEKAVLAENAVALSKLVEQETTVENLIKAAGFADCVVYLDGTKASVVVKSDGLQANQAAQIFDILLSQVTLEKENIQIYDCK